MTALDPGDTLTLEFSASPVPPGQVREWFLISRGVYTSDPAKALGRSAAPGSSFGFALAQNQPNPFTRATTIRFELPVACRVKLEVFDLMGRRVRCPATRWES